MKRLKTGRLTQVRAIAATTAAELLGQPTPLLLLLTGIIATALIPVFQFHSFFDEPGRLVRDGGLAYQLIFGLMLSVISASCALHSEIFDGTAAAAIAKPISRNMFLAGKWLGVMRVAFRFWFCMLAVIIIAERIPPRDAGNSLTLEPRPDLCAQYALLLLPPAALAIGGALHNRLRVRFCRTVGLLLTFGLAVLLVLGLLFTRDGRFAPSFSNIDTALIPISILIFAAVAVYSAIATALSTFLRAAPVMIICFALLFLGLSIDSTLPPDTHPALRHIAGLIPNLQSFWMCDILNDGQRLPLSYFFKALAYSASYITAALGAGMLRFSRRDL